MATIRVSPVAVPTLRASSFWFGFAAAVGGLHAAFSLYWACGGSFLLNTVGSEFVQLRDASPLVSAVALLIVAALKAAACALPWWAAERQSLSGKVIRAITWTGATMLALWGLAGTIGALYGIGVTGHVTPARVGHAFIWDPAFVVWGVALLLGQLFARPVAGRANSTKGSHTF